jgi:hypothetical protein
MDPFYNRYPASAAFRGILILLPLLCLGAPLHAEVADPYAAWDGGLTKPAIHPFAPIAPFQADYRFGWEGIGAGGATVRVTADKPGRRNIVVRGGPNALIRKLWAYQALYAGEAGANGEAPSWFQLTETQSKNALISVADFKPGSVFFCHRLLTEKKPWELTELTGVMDLFAAMLFVRSQPLHDGDKLRMAVFPDENPYLVDLRVVGRETLTIQGKKIPAIQFSLRIQTIETHGAHKGRVAPDHKFHSGRVWMSDDAERLPLRAEVDIFIGRVFAEIEHCHGEEIPSF